MTLKLELSDKRVVTIAWERIQDSRKICPYYKEINLLRVHEATKCEVEGIDRAYWGWAFMSRAEPVYDAARARKLSLQRAIKYAAKADRALVWQAYNKAFPAPAGRPSISGLRRADRALRTWLTNLAKGQAL